MVRAIRPREPRRTIHIRNLKSSQDNLVKETSEGSPLEEEILIGRSEASC